MFTPSSSSVPPPTHDNSQHDVRPELRGSAAPPLPHGSDYGSVMTASSTMRVAATSGDNSDQMDVDTAVGSSLSVGKRKHSDLPGDDVLAHDNHDDDSSLIDTAPPSSIPTSHSLPALSPSVPSAPSSSVRTSSNPLKKKKTASTRNSAGKVSSSVTGAPSSNIAIKITPAIAIHGMQGTLNRLTDVME